MQYTWFFIIPPIAIAIILFAAWYYYKVHSQDRDLKRVAVIAHTHTIKMLPAYRKAERRYRTLLFLAAVSFLISIFSFTSVAARPTAREERNTTNINRDIILCMDVSGSMHKYQAELLDMFAKMVQKLRGQKIGITIFDGKPANILPLSDDYDAIVETIHDLSENFASSTYSGSYSDAVRGSSSSAVGDGVMGCVNSLDKLGEDERSQSIIIATDNEYATSDGGSAQTVDINQVARYAKRYGISFYGIYTSEYVHVSVANEFENATKITGGSFYKISDYLNSSDGGVTNSIVSKIIAQEGAKTAGAPEIIYTDQPDIAIYVSIVSFALFISLIWRLRL